MATLSVANRDNYNFVEDSSIDFVLTDPPFNISKESNFHTYEKNTIHSHQFDGQSEEKWDSYDHAEFILMLDKWAEQWNRVLKKGGSFAIFCGDAYISHLMDALTKNNLKVRRLFIWRKNNAVPINRAHIPMSANEYIIVGVKPGKKSTFNADVNVVDQTIDDKLIEATIVADKVSTIMYSKIREYLLEPKNKNMFSEDEENHVDKISRDTEIAINKATKEALIKVKKMYKMNKNEQLYLQACIPNYVQNPIKVGNRIHPTEKPVYLLSYLIAIYSNQGDVILDGFGGSGSTGEAALNMDRNAIIIEREKEFFNRIVKRFDKHENINIITS